MGAASSCAIFQTLTTALCWIAERLMTGLRIFGYLDDFFLVTCGWSQAMHHVAQFEALCQEVGVPLTNEKTQGPSSKLILLG